MSTAPTATKETKAEALPPPPKSRKPVDELGPEDKVVLQLSDLRNAGKTVKSRFGKIAFDEKGLADLTVQVKDVSMIQSLGWLSKEDQEKYLGIAPEPEPEMKKMHENHKAQMSKAEQLFKQLTEENDELRKANEEGSALVRKQQADLDAQRGQIEALTLKLKAEQDAHATLRAGMSTPPKKEDDKKTDKK